MCICPHLLIFDMSSLVRYNEVDEVEVAGKIDGWAGRHGRPFEAGKGSESAYISSKYVWL